MEYLQRRPRRNRKSQAIRDLVQETSVSVNDLIFPMFVLEGEKIKSEIKSMPGIYRFSLDLLLEELAEVTDLGIKSICLFPNYPESKKDHQPTMRQEVSSVSAKRLRFSSRWSHL